MGGIQGSQRHNLTLEDLYQILQVHPHAGSEVLAAACNALTAKYYPDGVEGDEEKLELVSYAYAILSDPTKRREHQQVHKPDKTIGNYRIVSKIAEGGFGVTYKAEHRVAKEPVCLKQGFLHSPAHETILLEEAKAIWNLGHYCLPHMKDLLRMEDGSLVLVMSYVPGPTLEQLVQKVGALDAENVAWIADRVLNTLQFLHFEGVIHGDIKPQNIIVDAKKHRISLVDFGLTCIRPTASTKPKGYTEQFAPPEQMEEKPLLPESDLFSLGKTLVYALSGTYDSVARLSVPADTPGPLCKFIRRLVVRDPLGRPNWSQEDLTESFRKVRQQSFGRIHTDMKKIAGE